MTKVPRRTSPKPVGPNSEYGIVYGIYKSKRDFILNTIQKSYNSCAPMISSFTDFSPIVVNGTYESTQEIKLSEYDLYEKILNGRNLPLTTPFTRQYYSSPSVNMIPVKEMFYLIKDNLGYSVTNGGTFIKAYDATKVKDVAKWTPTAVTTTSIDTKFNSVTRPGSGKYLFEVNVKSDVDFTCAFVYSYITYTNGVGTTTTAPNPIVYTGSKTGGAWYAHSEVITIPENSYLLTVSVSVKKASGSFNGTSNYVMACDLKVRNLKLITETIGYSNTLLPVASLPGADSLQIPPMNLFTFKDKTSLSYIPVQFFNKRLKTTEKDTYRLGVSIANTILQNYNLPNRAGNKDLTENPMINPFVRTIVFKEESPGATFSIKEGKKTNYQTKQVEKKENRVSNIYTDLFSVDNSNNCITYTPDDETPYISFGSASKDGIILRKEWMLENFNSNLQFDKDNGLEILTQKFSAYSNCFDLIKVKSRKESIVAVTNIQLVYEYEEEGVKKTKILYEFEVPPIIYNEQKHHLSLNILCRRD